jgi:hypothetical protein
MNAVTIYGELLVPAFLLAREGSPQQVERLLVQAGLLPVGLEICRWRQEHIRAAYVLEYTYDLALEAEETRHAGP